MQSLIWSLIYMFFSYLLAFLQNNQLDFFFFCFSLYFSSFASILMQVFFELKFLFQSLFEINFIMDLFFSPAFWVFIQLAERLQVSSNLNTKREKRLLLSIFFYFKFVFYFKPFFSSLF